MAIIENIKEISELIKKYNDQELYQKIVELREEILTLKEESLALKEAISKQSATSDIAERITRRNNDYYLDVDTDKEAVLSVCPAGTMKAS